MASPPHPPAPPADFPPPTPGGGGPPRGRSGVDGRYTDPTASSEERTYGLFLHLVGLLSLASIPVPVAGLIGSAIMWKVKSDTSPYLDDHGRDAVNFQISLLVYHIAFAILIVPTLGLSTLGYFVTLVLALVGCIRGAMASNRGEYYRYPMTIRFLKDA